MKNLFDKIFNKGPQFNYIIAEYQPMKFDLPKVATSSSEYDVDEQSTSDEMEIDRIYQSS
jgi:hypothetical protein